MKTFERFLLEGVSDKVGSMSDDQFNQFMKGRTEEEAKTYRTARQKAKGEDKKDKKDKKPGGSIVVRKTGGDKSTSQASPAPSGTDNKSRETRQTSPRSGGVTGGLGPKSKGKEDFNKQRAASGPGGGVRSPLTYRSGKDEMEKKREEEKKKQQKQQKEKGKGLNLGIRDKLVGAATELAKTETNKDVQTYEAKPVA